MKAPDLKRWQKYFDFRDSGLSTEAAAKRSNLSSSTAFRFERGDQRSGGLEAASLLGRNQVAGNVVDQPISIEARDALEDFALFRLRYFGRASTPWQTRAAYDVLKSLETDQREYLVINCPPGSGKSTLFTHDIPCWLVARDRTLRCQIGARTERQARMYVNRIKKSLERDAPMRADAHSLDLGLQRDGLACLQDDFGAFKPEGRTDIWRAESLVVRQLDGVSLDDKEPTFSAWGQDSGFLGGRFDLVLWDDLVDRKNTRGEEGRINMQEWWGTEAETRLEPGGVLILQGQRIAHNDLFRYCLDMKAMDEKPKYRKVIYQAHDDDRCSPEAMANNHADLKPWPDSCLLDPHRIPWSMLEAVKYNDRRVYDVQYQQNDGDLVGGLVQKEWIVGGVDEDGYDAPGCLDKERIINEIPPHVLENGWSFVTVDPSPTEWWGVIWWIYDPVTQNRYAIDIIRRRMNPEQFLTLDFDTAQFSGLCVDLLHTSVTNRAAITHIIVETNAAQRWLLQQPHVQRWSQATGVFFIPHTTHINKQDPKYGLESIGDLFRQGRIRLPWGDIVSRRKTQELVNEATRYPESETTDLIMSTWFGKLAVENLYTPKQQAQYAQERPGWIRGARRGMPAFTR